MPGDGESTAPAIREPLRVASLIRGPRLPRRTTSLSDQQDYALTWVSTSGLGLWTSDRVRTGEIQVRELHLAQCDRRCRGLAA
jgi:hypothetical protein